MRRDLSLLSVIQKASGLLLTFSLVALAFALFSHIRLNEQSLTALLIGFSCWSLLLGLNHWYGIKLALFDAKEYRWQEKRQQSASSSQWVQRANEADDSSRIVFQQRYPGFLQTGQWILWIPFGALLIWSLYQGWGASTNLLVAGEENLRLLATLCLPIGIGFWLAVRYCSQLDMAEGRHWIAPVLLQTQLTAWVLILTSGVFFLALLSSIDLTVLWTQLLFWVLAVLLLDTILASLKSLFQPPSEENHSQLRPLFGNTFLLQLLFQRSHATSGLLKGLEHILGVPLNELWFWRSFRNYLPPFVIGIFLLFWLSSLFTVVPLGYEGVRVRLGQYEKTPLDPGLHTSLPWPWGKIELVPTQRIQKVVLGHETDLLTPILWTEKHYEGEINLLVGNGEELLTINMPVFYRITDPYRYLTGTRNAEETITHLAYHYLLLYTVQHDAYSVMSTDRQQIAQQIQDALRENQATRDLGIEIVAVTLKDVHPPLDVAAAYQEVISAQEEQKTEIEKGLSYQAEKVPETRKEVVRIQNNAFVSAVQRQEQAAADTASFVLLQPEYQASPQAFRHRLYLSTLEEVLQKPEKYISSSVPNSSTRYLLDFRNLQPDSKP